MSEDTTSGYRERTRGRMQPGGDTAKWAGIIVIGAVVILAVMAGGFRSFVNH